MNECAAKDEEIESANKKLSSLKDEMFAKDETICLQEAELEQLQTVQSLITKKSIPNEQVVSTDSTTKETDKVRSLEIYRKVLI